VTSGLKEALLILKETNGIGMLFLDDRDVIRHRLVKKVINAYKTIEHQN
jgi:phosphate starvation-inducible PhoH-like protein